MDNDLGAVILARELPRAELRRLVRNGDLVRIGHGLYHRPRWNRLLHDWSPPPTNEIVAAIARRDGRRFALPEAHWANALGFTNGVPAQVEFLTDGHSRTITVAGRKIRLRHLPDRWMWWHGRPGLPVVLALRWLGQRNVDELVMKKLARLPDDVTKDLLGGLDQMPQWMADIMRALEN